MDRQRMSIFVPADPDVQGISSFPCSPGTLGVHDRPAENPLGISDVDKVCQHLCLEGLLYSKCPLRIDSAGCRNGTNEREGA
jgi:hypothetical protein